MLTECRPIRLKRTQLAQAVVLCLLISCFAGCAFKENFLSMFQHEQPAVLPPDATLSQIVSHLNSNIANVRAWRSTKVTLIGHGSGAMAVRLQAGIAVEEPRNFRLQVSAMTIQQADLGSNDEQFWFWMRQLSPGMPKHVFMARHEDVANVQQLPFEPQWIMQALGVVPLREAELELKRPTGDTGSIVDLVERRTSQNGISGCHVTRVDTNAGHIIAHELYDSSNRLIARAELSDYRSENSHGVMLPHNIRLDWPHLDFGMTMKIGGIELNPTSIPAVTWRMPKHEGYPPLDIAQVRLPEGQPVVRAPGDDRRAEVPDGPQYDGARAGSGGFKQMPNEQPWAPDEVAPAGVYPSAPGEPWEPPFAEQPTARTPPRQQSPQPQRRTPWWHRMFGRS